MSLSAMRARAATIEASPRPYRLEQQ